MQKSWTAPCNRQDHALQPTSASVLKGFAVEGLAVPGTEPVWFRLAPGEA